MSLNITDCTHAPNPVINEISSLATHTDADDYIILYYIILYYIILYYIILYYILMQN